MNWRPAKSLPILLDQVNEKYPGRSKASDGMLGDAAHSARDSDHNPDSKGIVKALDITHDPKHGLDIEELADALVRSGDKRISYIIANRKIWMPGIGWRNYSGTNPHTKHLHLSVTGNYDSKAKWDIGVNDMPTEKEVNDFFNKHLNRDPTSTERKRFDSRPWVEMANYVAADLRKKLVKESEKVTKAAARIKELEQSGGLKPVKLTKGLYSVE